MASPDLSQKPASHRTMFLDTISVEIHLMAFLTGWSSLSGTAVRLSFKPQVKQSIPWLFLLIAAICLIEL